MDEELIEELAKTLWAMRIAPGGPGATMMPWRASPEADWCRTTVRALVAKIPKIVAVPEPYNELFDAAQTTLDWLRELHPALQHAITRPIAKFNRLEDALNGVRELHQMPSIS